MKKILLLIAVVSALFLAPSCSKNDEPTKALVVMSNVTINGSIASPSLVELYNFDSAKNFDKSYEGMISYGDHQKLLNASGDVLTPAYSSSSFAGVNTFEDVKAGKYIIVCLYKPDGFTYPMFYYYGYAEIEVSASNSPVMQNFKFTYDDERGEFLKF